MPSERLLKRIAENDILIKNYCVNFSTKLKPHSFEVKAEVLPKLINFFQIIIKTPKSVLYDSNEELKSLMNEVDQNAEESSFSAPRHWYLLNGAFNNFYTRNFTVTE